MKFVAILAGAVLLIVAVRGTVMNSAPGANDGQGLWPLLKGDFQPGQPGNFYSWAIAIIAIGLLGYIPELKSISNAMLALLIVVLLLTHHGFFQQLQAAIQQPAAKAA